MTRSVIIVHPNFDKSWPFAADHLHELWKGDESVEFIRLAAHDQRSLDRLVREPGSIVRLVTLGVPVTRASLEPFSALEEAVLYTSGYGDQPDHESLALLTQRGVKVYQHTSMEYWGQSVAEFGLALTLCGLRRIPQTHCQLMHSQDPWNYEPPSGIGQPGSRGEQFGDDLNFTNGTLEGKRVRIVGAGNIGSRYASFVRMIGADVAAWDPFASEPCFHRAGARREHHLARLVLDAEIFAPMLPLTASTRGLITAELIDALPKGCLVVLVTRAKICDVAALRQRVIDNELSLAADVFDIEPLPLDDPLLGRSNVIHTPPNAGRTREANYRFAEQRAHQFALR